MYVYVRRYDKHLTGKLKLSEFKLFHRDLWEQKHLDFEYSYDMCVEMFGESDFHVHYCKVVAFFRQVQCSTVWTEAECAVHMCFAYHCFVPIFTIFTCIEPHAAAALEEEALQLHQEVLLLHQREAQEHHRLGLALDCGLCRIVCNCI